MSRLRKLLTKIRKWYMPMTVDELLADVIYRGIKHDEAMERRAKDN